MPRRAIVPKAPASPGSQEPRDLWGVEARGEHRRGSADVLPAHKGRRRSQAPRRVRAAHAAGCECSAVVVSGWSVRIGSRCSRSDPLEDAAGHERPGQRRLSRRTLRCRWSVHRSPLWRPTRKRTRRCMPAISMVSAGCESESQCEEHTISQALV